MAAAAIKVTAENGNITIMGSGMLDLTNTEELRDGLARAAETAAHITVDLREAIFIDTAVLEYLARTRVALGDDSCRLKVLVAPDCQPLYVLETVGFTGLMDVVVGAGGSQRR
ncbi:MAG: STAS domain-containing protein [Armatimonadetes bacterium]|nr:STAS domain-containing protein [Armatimonadota bacterium]